MLQHKKLAKLISFNQKHVVRNFCQASGVNYDVLINGGGVVGAALALDLLVKSQGNCKIGIVERNAPASSISESLTPDLRVYAMSPKSISMLKRLGAWKYIDERSNPYTSMQIWESSGPGLVRFNAEELNTTELGRICEDKTIQTALYKAIEDQGFNVEMLIGSSISEFKTSKGGAQVKLTGTDEESEPTLINTRLLVGSDGGNSFIRKHAGISSWGWSYGQEAVVATVQLSETPSNNTAWQKYLKNGPLALLPLWGGYSSIVWSTTVSEAQRLKGLSAEEFLEELNSALQSPPETDKWSVMDSTDATSFPPFFDKLMGMVNDNNALKIMLKQLKREGAAVADSIMSAAQLGDPLKYPPKIEKIVSPKVTFPLSFQQASNYAIPRCALIGDAAHSIHPQAGQGLNLGLLDAEALADTVVEAMKVGADFGEMSVLKKYDRERSVKNLAMTGLVDAIHRVFSEQTMVDKVLKGSPPGVLKAKQFLRSFGMLNIHQLGLVKSQIAKFAMGLDGKKKA